MRTLRDERGSALITAVIVIATMLVLGTATLAIVVTQSDQTVKERTGESTFNLAEATLNAKAFLLARNWPQSGAAGSCSSQTVNGTLTTPASATTSRDQVQRLLAQAYAGDTNASSSQWWVTACAEDAGTPPRDSWDSSLLSRPGYDSLPASTGPRRMWVRAESHVKGRRRAVVGLVQADQEPVFPPDLAVVTGRIGGDFGSSLTNLTTGTLLRDLLGLIVNTNQDPMFKGTVGLRCSLLNLADLPGCISGVFKITSALPAGLGALLTGNQYVHFDNDRTISVDKVAQLRQQAQASGTYYTSVAANAPCLPAGSAGKVIFIEQVGGAGADSCTLNAAVNPSAKALVVGSGGIVITGDGTFTGVVYALRGKALTGNVADVRIQNSAHVLGAVFVDDNAALGVNKRGTVQVIVPVNVCVGLTGLNRLLCDVGSLLESVLLGIPLSSLLPQIGPYLPAVTYDGPTVKAVTTFNDSAIVSGTFRQVAPMY